MKFSSKALTILLMLLLAISLAACGSGGSDSASKNPGQDAGKNSDKAPIKLSLWGWVNDQTAEKTKFLDPALKEFNAQNDYNATIEYQSFESNAYKTKITTEVAANNAPDMFFTWEAGFMAPFVKSGNVIPLDDLLSSDSSKFVKGIFDQVSFDGKIYAMPLAQSSQLIYYNKEIFANNGLSVPKTMDDLINVVQALKTKGITPFALGNKDIWTGGLYLNTLAYRYGGKEAFTDALSGKIPFTDDIFVKAAGDFRKLVDAGAFAKDANSASSDDAKQQFLQSKAAMWVMGTWEMGGLASKTDASNGVENPLYGKVGLFNWPAVNGGKTDQNAWIVAPDYSIAISKNVKNKDAAAAFMKLLASDKYQNILVSISDMPVTNVPVDKSNVNPIQADFLDQLSHANNTITFPDRILGQNTLGGELSNSVQELLIGKDPAKAMQSVEDRVKNMRTK
jgi:raffinose/stachyose/melibiose transport system substrate-binding protein